AYQIAPHVFHELGADVIPIGVAPNGFNINAGVGATAPDALVRAVRANHADLGIALDGDADRLQVVDAAGRLYNGDELLYVLVKYRIVTDGKVEGAVGTLMTNLAVEVALQREGVKFVRAAVGDRYVLEQLREHGWQL
ncbi:phosphoglucosamine mutase, partial [Bacillus velezensis]|nr:phosphoglucosamine mutase [Bacillus velezensis]